MLVLSRKKNESLMVDQDILITVVSIRGGRVKLGINAPRNVNVVRQELPPLDKSPPDSATVDAA